MEEKGWNVLIIEAIKAFRVAIANFRLYPKGSKIIDLSLQAFYSPLMKLLTQMPSLTISEAHGNLVINEKELDLKGAEKTIITDFAFILAEHGIGSISFKKGLEIEELKVLVEALSKKREEIKERGGFENLLKQAQATHIGINETIYVALTKGESIVKHGEEVRSETAIKEETFKELLEERETEVEPLIRFLKQNIEMLEGLGDPTSQEGVIEQIMKKVADFKLETLIKFWETPLPSKLEAFKVKEKILSILTPERLEELLEELLHKANQSELNSQEAERIKNFAHYLAQSPAIKQLPEAIFEKLETSDLLPKAQIEEAKVEKFTGTPQERAEKLLEKNPAELSSLIKPNEFSELINNLELLNESKLVEKVIHHYLPALNSLNEGVRNSVVQYLKNALAVLTNKGDTEIWLLIGEKFAERLPKETHLPTYRELALSLSSHAVSLLRKRAFDKTQKFIKLLRKQALPESGVEIERRKVAEESLLSFSRDTIELLLNDLKSENSKRELGAHRILGILGERVIKYLVQMVKEAEDVRLREVVSSLLIELKDKAKWALLEELTPSVNYDEAQRILQVLASLQDEEILDHLSSPLTHPNPRVRAEVGKLLLKYGSEKAEKLLLQQLADESREVQNQAIKSLGELRSKRALPYLVKLLKVRDIGIKKELCQTFEKLGDETSLKSLIKLYGGRNVKWFGRREPLEVRVAAIWALKSFRRHEAKETLLKASQEKDISIQSAARRALEKLKEAL